MNEINVEEIVHLIIDRLSLLEERLHAEFQESINEVGIRYCVIDDLLPNEIAERISFTFPCADSMRLMNSFREKKYTSKSFDKYDSLIRDITFAIQDPRVVCMIERITGFENQIPDSSLYAGGLSAMTKGQFLGPHLDNSHDGIRKNYRTLNLLYYVTTNWSLENGGNLELWDHRVRRHVTIESRFNRLAIMETNPISWHSVSEVKVDRVRKCVSNYYFSSQSPTGEDYFNVTSFSARPEQKFLRIFADMDNRFRRALRKLVPNGLGKKDIYKGTTS